MQNNQDGTNEGDSETQAIDYPARKRRILFMFLACSFFLGAACCFLPDDGVVLDWIVSLPFLILCVSWCFTDAEERNHRIAKPMRLLLILLFIVGFPLYLFQTRGVRGFVTLGLSLLFVVAIVICLLLSCIATLYFGEQFGFWRVAEFALCTSARFCVA